MFDVIQQEAKFIGDDRSAPSPGGAIVVEIALDELSGSLSPRLGGENAEHVEALSETHEPLPPILVHRSTMRVIDGLHRVLAARRCGEEKISAVFFDGSEADAFVLAVRANVTHGLPLTRSDRKRAARRIVGSHPHWSDRMIAAAVGVAPATVAEVRRRAPAGLDDEPRLGSDGKLRRLDPDEGRRVAGEVIRKNPGMSLRQIARLAGISPETVRDVKNRIMRGEDGRLTPRHADGARLSLARRAVDARPVASPEERARLVERLRADPALRLNNAGRALLRLLGIHTISQDSWDALIEAIPPHAAVLVAQLAEECAKTWAEFASRVERDVAGLAGAREPNAA
ncbi:MAG TPA: ParB N-terminal domain-containing protein [Trebonia sp.]|nr:ParB N-terminal domain-containing protein [Trebonia sp.]